MKKRSRIWCVVSAKYCLMPDEIVNRFGVAKTLGWALLLVFATWSVARAGWGDWMDGYCAGRYRADGFCCSTPIDRVTWVCEIGRANGDADIEEADHGYWRDARGQRDWNRGWRKGQRERNRELSAK